MNKLLTTILLLVIVGCSAEPKKLGNTTTYTIKPNEEAIVFDGRKQNHVIATGQHYLTPGQRVVIYDLSKTYSQEVGTDKYILFNKKMVELNATFNWRICEPEEHADNFSGSGLDTATNKRVMSVEMRNAIRVALYDEKVTDPNEIGTEEFYGATRFAFEQKAKSYGVCLVYGPNASDKAIYFTIN